MVSNKKNKTKNSGSHDHNHPEPITYFKVAMALVALTALEVVVFYFEWLGYAIIPVMAILSIGKFGIVVMLSLMQMCRCGRLRACGGRWWAYD